MSQELSLLRRWSAFTLGLQRATSRIQLLDAALDGLYGLVEVELVAVLLASPGHDPLLHVRPRRAMSRSAIVGIRDQLLRMAAQRLPSPPAEADLVMHLGPPRQAGEPSADEFLLTTAPIGKVAKIAGEATPIGLLAWAEPTEALTIEAELLQLCADEIGLAESHLAARVDDERRRLGRLVDAIPDGLVMSDSHGRILLCNPTARRVLRLGATPSGELGPLVAQRLGFDPFIPGAFRGTVPLQRRLTVGESAVDVLVTSAPGEDGRPLGNVLVIHDRTRERRIEERKDEFITVVSHELRTPLQSLSGSLELLLQRFAGDLNAKQHRYIEVAYESSRRLERIVQDLFALARAKEDKLKVDLTEHELGPLVHGLVDPLRPVLESRQIELRLRTWQRARVQCDADRLSQVLANLLQNAIKHTPERGRVDVEVFANPSLPGFVLCSVYNSGRAIPPEFHERIFDKFEQVEVAATRRTEGAGLGLAICRSIVDAHGGRIWVEPENEGARFVFALPAAGRPLPRPIEGRFTGSHRLVAVQSSQRASALLLRHELERAGYRVVVAIGREPPSDLAPDVTAVYDEPRGGDGRSATLTLRGKGQEASLEVELPLVGETLAAAVDRVISASVL